MKIIISHDVDHITAWEHISKDLIIPKFLVRSMIEFSIKKISASELKYRFKELLKNKWNYIEELMEFDKSYGIPSTFFVGVNNGKGLSYSLKNAEYWIKRIKANGFDVGVHGICYKSLAGIKKEYETFKKISGPKEFGIRMHYLRIGKKTLRNLSEIGYSYDSSVYGFLNPFKVRQMWEIPTNLMDVRYFKHFYPTNNSNMKDHFSALLQSISNHNLKYFVVLFHDRYFSQAYPQRKSWYIKLILFLKQQGFDFINFTTAINELENK